tara:strand:+ start:171032 stop:172942 length:1911 start_codon:yes stop_codon:yes gene_type:complete
MKIDKFRKHKIITIFCAFIVMFVLVVGKAFKVQVIDRKELITRSESQTYRKIKVYPKRGNIYDRNGNPLAINIQTYSIFTIPKKLKSEKNTYRKISQIIPKLNYKDIVKKISGRKRFTWIARKISLSKEQVESIKSLKGVYIDSVPKRLYPNHEIAAQILGFVGIDNTGLSGIEYLYDEMLRGEPKIVKYFKDAKGRPVKFESYNPGNEAKDLKLTIDKDLQAVAEKHLKEAVVEHEALSGGVGIIDVESGEVLAMANYPTFDPNHPRSTSSKYRKLSFVTDPFEPGSTMKAFTVSSVLENKIATPETSYFCERGSFKVDDHIISEADSKKKHEWLTVKEIIKYSSNIGTTKIAFDLTYPKLKKTLENFNFGEKTGVEIPGESRGIFNSNENVTPLTLSNISFGQGIATTGIQMLTAYAAIANGGKLVRPTIIKNDSKKESKQIISKDTAQKMEKMLLSVVEDGTGSAAQLSMFKIAGKTSTAQRVDEKGGYSGHVGGFIGYPVNVDKKFVMYVYIDNPKGSYYGNVVAAPVFNKISQYLLYKNKDFSKIEVAEHEDANNFDTVKIKHSSVRSRGKGKVPNFIGLDKFSSKRLADKYGVSINSKGIGVVVEQLPPSGETISENTKVLLKFSPPSYE